MEISVMKGMISAASVLALAAGASAAPFQFLGYQSGGGLLGVAGPAFNSSLGFINTSAGPTIGSPDIAPGKQGFEWDSYFTIDDVGGSALAASSTANFYGDYPGPAGYNGTDGTDFNTGTPSSLTVIAAPGSNFTGTVAQAGAGISPQPFFSGFAPAAGGGRSTVDGVMIARLSVPRGSVLSGGSQPEISEGGNNIAAVVMLGGGPVAFGTQSYELVAHLVAQPNGAIDDGGFVPTTLGDLDVYDVWFQVSVIPTPGSLALLGLGGLATLRRRRA